MAATPLRVGDQARDAEVLAPQPERVALVAEEPFGNLRADGDVAQAAASIAARAGEHGTAP